MGAPSPGTRSPAQKQDMSASSQEQFIIFIICPAAGAARPHAAGEWHGARARAPASGAQGKHTWEPQKKITGEVEGGSSREKTPGRRSQGTVLSRARAVSVSWDGWEGWHSRAQGTGSHPTVGTNRRGPRPHRSGDRTSNASKTPYTPAQHSPGRKTSPLRGQSPPVGSQVGGGRCPLLPSPPACSTGRC